jgi:hypothetical protein
MEGVIVLHETIQSYIRRNRVGVILIIDFEKTYDKVR